MLKKAYAQGVRAAIKHAQENGLLGKITAWAEDNPSIAAGVFGQPALKTMKTVQEVDPEAARIREVAAETLSGSSPSQQLFANLLQDPTSTS